MRFRPSSPSIPAIFTSRKRQVPAGLLERRDAGWRARLGTYLVALVFQELPQSGADPCSSSTTSIR
jgi:hypothetical protein